MFKAFYGLTCNPFDKHNLSTKDFFKSYDFKEMLSRLNYIKDVRGIGVFTASPGMGKTYALRCFAENLNPNLFQLVYICLSTVSITEFYRQLCTGLNVDVSQKKADMFNSIQTQLFSSFKEKRRPIILVIDEAHELNSCILKDIKMIMNHKLDSLNCFTLLLIGESHLNNIIHKPVNEALRQRITIHYSFTGLSQSEVSEYISHKLSLAGASSVILSDSVFSAVFGASQGNPRMIDNIMTYALTIGYQLNKEIIDTDIILAAVNNLALL